MPFLSLNGITVPVENASMSRSINRKGDFPPAVSGALSRTTRELHRSWDFDICFQNFDEGKAFINLLEGNGHFWDFANGVEASTGLQPSYFPPMAIMPNIWGLNGRGVAHVDAFQTNVNQGHFRVNPSFEATNWTILWSESIGSGWSKAAKKSNGTGFLNGVTDNTVGESGGSTWNRINVVDGQVVMYGTQASGTMGLDDVLMLPWYVPDSWLETWTSLSGPKLPSMPFLTATGDFISNPYGTAYVVGKVNNVSYTQMRRPSDNAWQNNAVKISATIFEVDPYYANLSARIETTPIPPGDPEYWYSSSDVDGFGNATLYNGAPVSSWKNSGSEGGAATNGTTILPLYQPHSHGPNLASPGVIFNLTTIGATHQEQKLLQNRGTAFTGFGNRKTVFAVYRTFDNLSAYVCDGPSSSGRNAIAVSGSAGYPAIYGGAFVNSNRGGALVRKWEYVLGTFGVSGGDSIYIDGSLVNTGTAGSTSFIGMSVGGRYSGTQMSGSIAGLYAWYGQPSDNGITAEQIFEYARQRYEGLS